MVRSRERSPIIGCGECAASVVMTLALAVVAQVRNKAIYALREFILPLAWRPKEKGPPCRSMRGNVKRK
jgi:hypothetical protein